MAENLALFEEVLRGQRLWLGAPPSLHASCCKSLRMALGRAGVSQGAVFATSGTEGVPKFVQLSLPALRGSAVEINQWLRVTSQDHFFLVLPDYHVGGFMVGLRAAVAGATLSRWQGAWQPQAVTAELARTGVSITSMVPTQVVDLVRAGVAAPPGLRALVVGGAALSDELAGQARDLGWPVLRSFGMTETASQVATESLNASCRGLPILPHWKARSRADGRLELDGDSLFDGYWQRDASAQWQFVERQRGWWCSADRVEISNNCLKFLERGDAVVKILGEQVSLSEVQGQVDAAEAEFHRSTDDTNEVMKGLWVVDLPCERAGRRLCLVGESGLDQIERIASMANQKLSKFARICTVYRLEEIPRSAMGKVSLARLREAVGACSGKELG